LVSTTIIATTTPIGIAPTVTHACGYLNQAIVQLRSG